MRICINLDVIDFELDGKGIYLGILFGIITFCNDNEMVRLL